MKSVMALRLTAFYGKWLLSFHCGHEKKNLMVDVVLFLGLTAKLFDHFRANG